MHARSAQFAQFGEDVFVESHFSDVEQGFYVDVGAFHPFQLSNTYLLYRKGWRGINIEPNPEGYRELVKHRNQDLNIHNAISSEDKMVDFTCDGAYSGINDATHLFRDRVPDATRIQVRARLLRSILNEHVPDSQTIHYMSIDCEGHDKVVIDSNDWNKFRPLLLLVEDHDLNHSTTTTGLLNDYGYHYYCRMGFTKVFLEEKEAFKFKSQYSPAGRES